MRHVNLEAKLTARDRKTARRSVDHAGVLLRVAAAALRALGTERRRKGGGSACQHLQHPLLAVPPLEPVSAVLADEVRLFKSWRKEICHKRKSSIIADNVPS